MEPIPPCPESLLGLRRPLATRLPTVNLGVRPGTIWEARAPDGGLFEFLLPACPENEDENPRDFVRAIPLTGALRLMDRGDAAISNEAAQRPCVAHSWLEGPILVSALERCIGHISETSAGEVARAREVSDIEASDGAVAEFRRALAEQIDPYYDACWGEILGDAGRTGQPEEAARVITLERLRRELPRTGIRLAAAPATEDTAPSQEELLHWMRWISFAGTARAATDLLAQLPQDVPVAERQLLERAAQGNPPMRRVHVCWLLLVLRGADAEILRPAVAVAARLQPFAPHEPTPSIGGLSADERFRAAVQEALQLGGELDLDGKRRWALDGLGVVPQGGSIATLEGGSAGLAVYANLCWARRGVRPEAQVALTGVLEGGRFLAVNDIHRKLDAARRAGVEWVVAVDQRAAVASNERDRLILLPDRLPAMDALGLVEAELARAGVRMVPDAERWDEWIGYARKVASQHGDLPGSRILPLARLWKSTPAGPNEIEHRKRDTTIAILKARAVYAQGFTLKALGDFDVARARLADSWGLIDPELRWMFFASYFHCTGQWGDTLPAELQAIADRMVQEDEDIDDESAVHRYGGYADWSRYSAAQCENPDERAARFRRIEEIYLTRVRPRQERLDQIKGRSGGLNRTDTQLASLYLVWGRLDQAEQRLAPLLDLERTLAARQLERPDTWRFAAGHAHVWLSLRKLSGLPIDEGWLDWRQQTRAVLEAAASPRSYHALFAAIERSALILDPGDSIARAERAMAQLADASKENPGRAQLAAWSYAVAATAHFRIQGLDWRPWADRVEEHVAQLAPWYRQMDRVRRLSSELTDDPPPSTQSVFSKAMTFTLF